MGQYRSLWLGGLAILCGSLSACDLVAGIGTYCEIGVDPGCGAGGTGGAGGVGGGGGPGGGGTTSTSTAACEPESTGECYSGPEITSGVGLCKTGTQTCDASGAWGTCTGEVLPAVETCVAKDDEDCDGNECARWSLISDGATSLALGFGLKTDSQGNVIVFGGFQGSLSFGGASVDAMSGTLFLAKVDPTGELLWLKNFGPVGDFPPVIASENLAIDANDNIVIAGNFEGTLNLGSGDLVAQGEDFFVAKLTSSGDLAWSRKYGGANDQELWEVAVDTQGAILVSGTYPSGFLLGGTFVSGTGAFVAHLSGSNGTVDSVMHIDPVASEFVEPHFAVGPAGTWAIAGRCKDGAFIGMKALTPCTRFVAKFGPDDALLWAVNVPVAATHLVMDSTGAVVLVSDFQNTIDMGTGPLNSNGSSDIVVAKLASEDGATQWARPFGGEGDDEYGWLAIDATDRIYLTFPADDSIDFGGGLLKGAGLSDAFVAALDSEGKHRWSRVFGDATSQTGPRLAVRNGGTGLIVSLQTQGEVDFGAGPLVPNGFGFALAELAP